MKVNKKSAVEQFQDNIRIALAKYYSDAISDNVKRAFEQKRQNGEFIGLPPFGYRYIHTSKKRKILIPDRKKSKLVKKIFALYSNKNNSIQDVYRIIKLSNKYLPLNVIKKILENTFYIGLVSSRKHSPYMHQYETFITKDVFDKCQKKMFYIKKANN